ncbi:MAG: RIP metalloprotease RseP [Gallionella sp.]
MITLLAFIGAIALLVTFHELGHYWVARRCGVKVLRFSLGFGKIIYSKRFANSDTEWVISAIPLGGYVKMLDEREGEVAPAELHLAFNRKPVLQRMAIVVAGPVANFLLAIVLYWAMFIYGVPGLKPVLGDVPVGTPAAVAQMQAGDTILSINDEKIPSWQQLHWMLLDAALKQGDVKVEARTTQHDTRVYMLNMSSLEARDLEGSFLEKLGLKPYQPIVLPVIGKLVEGGVAQHAGLKAGDKILRANDVPMKTWQEVVEVIRIHSDQSVQLEIQRGEVTLPIAVIPQSSQESGKTVGKIGVAPQVNEAEWDAMFTDVRYAPLAALSESVRKTWQTSIISLKMMGKLVMGEISAKNISGPITIADYAGQSAGMGIVAYLGFLALISISLGVMNLLPIPLLDGGHLLYYAVELIKGSPVSEQAWEIGQKIGIAILGTLMTFAIFNDVTRLFSS